MKKKALKIILAAVIVFAAYNIIWPKVSGGYDFGVLLYENDMEYAIYIDSNGNALSKEDKDIVSRHSDSIRNLLMMADERWDIYD